MSEQTLSAIGDEGSELRRVGKYELVERIGKGGMGVVYRGRDSVLGRPVAVKMLISEVDVSDESRERFFREARSAGQLAHRNIITIYDFGEEQGRAYIVMELLSGRSLAAFFESMAAQSERLSVEQQVETMARVCEGLAFAHARGIVHRDVKPANIFLTSDGQVKLLDFGVARIASSKLTRSGFIVGTPDYMSPEQVMGKVVDPRSDIFSAGSVFYEIVTGRRPFTSRKLPQILNNVMTADPAPVSEAEAPPALAAIIMKALAKSPDGRYPRMLDMLVALTGFLQAWGAETRALAHAACGAYHENARLLASRTSRQAGGAAEEVAAVPLLQDLPLFQERGGDVLKVVPFRRAKVLEIARVLADQHARLVADPF